MDSRYFILFFILSLIGNAYGLVKGDVPQAPNPNILEPVKQSLNQFRAGLDQTLATVVEQVNVKQQLEPIVDALGDTLNRLSKVLVILTAPKTTTQANSLTLK